jgi:hypothetical protein
MTDKDELMHNFDQARAKTRSILPGLDPGIEIYPHWTIKEILAHLAGWDDATIAALQAYNVGEATPLLADRGIDFYNSQTVAERAGLSYEQIRREWELVRQQLNSILAELPARMLEDRITSPWGSMVSVAELITIMTEHEEEHAEVIEAKIKR